MSSSVENIDPKTPMISVITVVYNGEKHIRGCLESICSQSYENTELIIIDGGSTDSTCQIIREFEGAYNYFVSEPDKGIANAMNKGLEQVNGEYVLFIHSDDYLNSSTVLAGVSDLLVGGSDILLARIAFGKDLKIQRSRGFGVWTNFKTGVFHQGAICRRDLFERVGYFDENYKIAMDYDFFLRRYREGLTVARSDIVLSVMRDTGISSETSWASLKNRFGEEKRIHGSNSNSFALSVLYLLYWPCYTLYRGARQLFVNG